MRELTPNRRVRGEPAGWRITGTLQDDNDGHPPFRSERPDVPDPARRQLRGTLAEFGDLGEESTGPRKVWTDTIITTASYPSRRSTWDRRRVNRTRPACLRPGARARATTLKKDGEATAMRQLIKNLLFDQCVPWHRLPGFWAARTSCIAAQNA